MGLIPITGGLISVGYAHGRPDDNTAQTAMPTIALVDDDRNVLAVLVSGGIKNSKAVGVPSRRLCLRPPNPCRVLGRHRWDVETGK